MGSKRGLFILFLLIGLTGRTQLFLPLHTYYSDEVERVRIDDTLSDSHFQHHVSFKPVLDSRTNLSKIYENNEKYYYWITQKLFKENFIVFEGEDFWCSIDPIIDLELGSDLSADSLERLYWNTRGIRIQGKFFDKVGFSTSVFENQAFLPQYQRDYVDGQGEFFPNSLNTKYQQNNAVIPGYARTKAFKTTGYDFAFAEGSVLYAPNKNINFQLGNGNQFIGNGYRSLLLSDYSTNYPFAKIETNFWDGRIQYIAMYAIHQNLYRLFEYSTPEATFEKKIGTYHYLEVSVAKNLQIGVFEANHWKRVDSLGSHKPDLLFTNPIILVNTALNSFNNEGFKSVLGINARFTLGNSLFYGQAVFSGATIGGFQLGAKTFHFIFDKLSAGVEFNHVDLNTYLSPDKRYNYSHYNLPLAHPMVAGFNELTTNFSYQGNHFFIQNRFTYSERFKNDSLKIGNDILNPVNTINKPTHSTFVVQNQFEIGYRFNKNNNLQAFIGHLYRNETQPTQNPLTNYTYIGVRTSIKNKYLDF